MFTPVFNAKKIGTCDIRTIRNSFAWPLEYQTSRIQMQRQLRALFTPKQEIPHCGWHTAATAAKRTTRWTSHMRITESTLALAILPELASRRPRNTRKGPRLAAPACSLVSRSPSAVTGDPRVTHTQPRALSHVTRVTMTSSGGASKSRYTPRGGGGSVLYPVSCQPRHISLEFLGHFWAPVPLAGVGYNTTGPNLTSWSGVPPYWQQNPVHPGGWGGAT